MRNNKKRGFTLVELLVVIAILAILATVSVVGYTSYIESTQIKVDENLAAQLNHLLDAYKVGLKEDVDENNIREITLAILKDGGLEGKLIAKSSDYDFYFDLEEGKYVLLKDSDSGLKVEGYKVMLGLDTFAADSKYEIKLENCFTPDNRYFYVGSTNEDSPISLIIDAFYNFSSTTNYEELKSKVNNISIPNLLSFVENSVIVTDECNYRLGSNPTNIIFVNGIKMIGATTKVWDVNGWRTETVNNLANVEGKVTIPNSIKYFADDSLICGVNAEIHINKTAEQLSKMASGIFTDSKLVLKDGTFYTDTLSSGLEGVTNKNAGNLIEYPFHYVNELVNFGAELSGTDKKFDNDTLNSGYIAWEKGTTVNIAATGFVGADSSIPATGTAGITWAPKTDADARFVSVVDNKIVLNLDAATAADQIPSTLVLEGTAANGLKRDYTLTVVYLTGVDYTIDGVSVTEKVGTGMTLLYGDEGKTSFTVEQVLSNLNITGTDIEIVPEVSLTHNDFTLTSGSLTISNDKLTGEFTLDFETAGYSFLKKSINITLLNVNSLVFAKDHANHVYVGDDNAITLGDLFKLNPNMTIPDTAKVYIFTQTGDTPFAIDKNELSESSLAKNNLYSLSDEWASTPVEFTGGTDTFSTATQYKAIVTVLYEDENGNYVRIADNHELMVINGVNVTSFNQINGTTNNILYSNVAMTDTDSVITISSGKTLYGSGYSIDMTGYNDIGTPFTDADGKDSFYFEGLKKTVKYSKTDEALITLNGATLSNVKIVGEVYKSSDFLYQTPEQFAYGASLVKANDGSMIDQCYLANCRSPLKVTGTVTVQNSTLFGGNYANIDVAATKNSSDKLVKTELILKGTVTTINQVIEGVTDETLGVGIVVDLFAHKDSKITIESTKTLVQYNYIEKSEASLLPIVTYTMDMSKYGLGNQDVNVFLSTEVGKVYTDYRDWVFVQGEEENSKEYFNSGVIFLNSMKFSVDGIGGGLVEGFLKGMFGSSQGTGDGIDKDKLPTGYVKDYTIVTRSAKKGLWTMTLNEYVYIYSPQNTVAFNNTLPEGTLPSENLGR